MSHILYDTRVMVQGGIKARRECMGAGGWDGRISRHLQLNVLRMQGALVAWRRGTWVSLAL